MQLLRYGMLIVGFSCVILAGLFSIRALWMRPPGLIIIPQTIVYQSLQQQQRVESIVHLRNDFAVPVRIVRIHKSCGCLEVVYEKGEINPGNQRELKIVWETGEARGDVKLSVIVQYELQGGVQRAVKIPIEGVVEPDINISPANLEIRNNTLDSTVLMLSSGKGTVFQILEVTTSHPSLSAQIGQDGCSVHVAFNSNHQGAMFQTVPMEIQIRTGGERESPIRVPVKVIPNS